MLNSCVANHAKHCTDNQITLPSEANSATDSSLLSLKVNFHTAVQHVFTHQSHRVVTCWFTLTQFTFTH